MKAKVRRRLKHCKRRIQRRLRNKQWAEQSRRLLRDRNIHYEISDEAQGLHCGGIGAIHLLVQQLCLANAMPWRSVSVCAAGPRHSPTAVRRRAARG